jgi:uncharacterized protein YcfL
MKKIIITITTLMSLFIVGCSSKTSIKEDSKKNAQKSSIDFKGRISNIKKYDEYSEMSISTENNGYISIKVAETKKKKESDRISGRCSKYNYGMWKNCYIR